MKIFTFFWKNGKREVLEGSNEIDALFKAGYSVKEIRKVSFYTPGKNENYIWSSNTESWGINPSGIFRTPCKN